MYLDIRLIRHIGIAFAFDLAVNDRDNLWKPYGSVVHYLTFNLFGIIFLSSLPANILRKAKFVIEAAWTRRSRSEAAKRPNRKSWKQRTDMYLRPFLLNIFFSKRFIHAKVMHRGTSKVISVATTNAKDLRNTLPSLIDNNAARVIGKLIAERSKEADVYAIAYEPGRNERIEGRLGIILDTIQENGIIFV
nr:50S ribosomal protein L18-like [Nicotiana tomentosiformis]